MLTTRKGIRFVLSNTWLTMHRPFSQPLRIKAGGWVAVYATGGAANSDGSVTLQGYDR